MERVCLKLLNMSITAGWLIIAVIVLRLLLKRAPKWISCLLWALVAVRLICPFSFESVFSLIPSGETVSQETIRSDRPAIDSGVAFVDSMVNSALWQSAAPEQEESTEALKTRFPEAMVPETISPEIRLPEAMSPKLAAPETASPEKSVRIWFYIASAVWCAGLCALLAYALVSYLQLRLKVRTAVRLEEGVYVSEFVDTPFILGVVRPRVYLPAGMEETLRESVIAHERAHLSRGDHLWKPLGYLLLAVYWFQPLCWAAYWLFCRDIEFACDEKVIRNYDPRRRKQYSEALLACSVDRRAAAIYPLAFGEVGVKQRIKSVLHYKKPAVWLVAAAVAVCGITAVCLLTDPVSDEGTAAAKGQNGERKQEARRDPDQNIGQSADTDTAQDIEEDQEKENQNRELRQQTVNDWIQAFVNRDGEKIAALASDELKADLQARKLLTKTAGGYGFGDSAAWPKDAEADVSLREMTEDKAVICYYAWDAYLHITVWRETLALEARNGEYVVTGEEIERLEDIASEEDFFTAYKGLNIISDVLNLNYSRVNYLKNGAGEELNRNALLSSSYAYQDLFEPESAAYAILNLSRDAGEVKVERLFNEDGVVGLRIDFVKEGGSRRICMIQPYGENGIWIPQDFFLNPLYRLKQLDWNEIESRGLTVADAVANWQNEVRDIICIGEIPEKNIKIYGYNDEECFGRGVAVVTGEDVRCFDWTYRTPRANLPEYYWDGEKNQLQIIFTPNTGTGVDEQELHILQYDDAGRPTDKVYDMLGGAGWHERVQAVYDEETRLITLTDLKDGTELASIEVDEEKMGAMIEFRIGNIAHFSLGEKITLNVAAEGVYEKYGLAYLCSLEAEVIWREDENEITLGLGEIRIS